jgi:hypothetical protein
MNVRSISKAAAIGLVALSTVGPLTAQSAKVTVDMKGPAPHLPNGKPDFSGNWTRPGVQDMTRTFTNANGTSNKGEPNPLPFTPWGQAQWDNYNPPKDGDYAGSCMPFGWIRSFTPHPMSILQNNENIAFLFEQSTMFQMVNTEGLPHRKDWPPTWFGDSRGHWEGETLVIESVNMNGNAKLGTIGHPMSDEARLTMYFKRPDMGHIEFTWVLDDPKTYTRPIRNERVFVLTPQVELMEYACSEGNLSSLIDGSITPWLHPPEQEENVIPVSRQWGAYDLTKSQKFTGTLKEKKWGEPLATARIDVGGKVYDVILGPPVRMDFRGLTDDKATVGSTISFQGVPNKQNPNEFRAETFTLGRQEYDLR